MGTDDRSVPWWSVLAGVVAGLVLVAVAQLASLAFSAASAPFVAVGGGFVDIIPPWVKDLAIGLFGTNDKAVLFVSMIAVYVVLTGLLGAFGSRRPRIAAAGLAGLGVFAAVIVLTRADTGPVDVIPTVAGTLTAVPLLLVMLRAVHPAATATAWRRRRALLGIGALGVGAVLATAIARGVIASREIARRAAQYVLPAPTRPAEPIPADAQVEVEGMPPFITPNADFYRIDTALAVPRVDPSTWQLRVHGLVDRELTLDFEELLAEPMVETHLTLTCVSNRVGGELAGNATWLGVPVRTLLERAGVQDGADMVLSRSVDGFTASTPLGALTDDRSALIAVGMNGEPLPREHGYPVRMVVPGLYGYVSATKWLTSLKVTRFADDVAYWTTRGWSERGPIKTASRIDVPSPGGELTAADDGSVVLAGTAWAQQRGIAGVEVRIDDGPWQEAQLAAEVSEDTWVQWSLSWDDAIPGEHTVTVRATDGDGVVQTSREARPAPNGSSGWHAVDFTVS